MTSTCSIKRVEGRKAVIAKFTNGRLKEGKSQVLKFKHLTNGNVLEDNSKDDNITSRSVLIAKRETDTCQTYIGDTQNNSLSSQFYNYYVGVRNKRTGKMKVFDAELFNMIPDVKVDSMKEDKLDKLLPMTYTDQMKELTKAFGSTKRQRLVTQAQKNELKEDVLESAIGNAVDHAVSQENYTEIMAKKPTDDSNNCIPTHHLDTDKPEDIYKAEEIIGGKEMTAITNLTQKLFDFTSEDFQNEEGFGHYIMNRLPILPLDETRRWEKCKCLLYIHCLIVLYRKKANELRAKDILPKAWPDILKQSLLNNFTLKIEGDGKKRASRCMSVRMKDKIILHILVLCLIVDNFTLEYSDILKDLKIGEKRMPLLLRSVGCQIKSRVVNKVNVRTAHLTAPLLLPSQNLLSSKRK